MGYSWRTIYRRGRSYYPHYKRWEIHCLLQEDLKQFISNEMNHSKTRIFDYEIYDCNTSVLSHLGTCSKLGKHGINTLAISAIQVYKNYSTSNLSTDSM